MSDEPPFVLVVEDEPDLADLYAAWLDSQYRIETAYGGQEAIDKLDPDIDVILLDRRMPGLSGDDVLEEVRGRGIDCRIAMVTAVEPDFDIVEMGFDDYLVKPVTRDELAGVVETLVERSNYDTGLQELYALSSKKALLETEKGTAALQDSEEYRDLTARLEQLQAELDETVATMGDSDDFETLFREFEDADADFDEGSSSNGR